MGDIPLADDLRLLSNCFTTSVMLSSPSCSEVSITTVFRVRVAHHRGDLTIISFPSEQFLKTRKGMRSSRKGTYPQISSGERYEST